MLGVKKEGATNLKSSRLGGGSRGLQVSPIQVGEASSGAFMFAASQPARDHLNEVHGHSTHL